MEPSPSRKQATHDRILDTAASALRSDGFGGVGVADIMRRSGLTHGGFYAHFPSRNALLSEALERAGEDSQARLQRAIDAGVGRGLSPLRALVDSYLSDRHLQAPESGCPVAALACEMPRQPDDVQPAALARVNALLSTVQQALPPSCPEDTAAVVTGQLVGALQLARALGDNRQGRRHLALARRFLIDQFEPEAPAA